MIQFIVVVVRR